MEIGKEEEIKIFLLFPDLPYADQRTGPAKSGLTKAFAPGKSGHQSRFPVLCCACNSLVQSA
ncbi:hypothetical protein A3D78_04075 [Candidatus Gottesmanbacteria bacterium RIFCSPHIGHO2_02_FULL_39_14]|uniref:Uncharacterized protein n=1 Tax=Candidatus Gottesmanbacteria bacterium RIFCSPHIGHO2_02_FULL_39_14 TaxID=1798383 RepID=A0A1F5ZYX0_9BACT|nr:MAG: hypothetical protein A3D78_04075 [Candidatus Gottesmanbacteria bacterium RIFCSPHIGHO2_02_FULL_39_14]